MKLSEKLQYVYDCGKSQNGITVGKTTMLIWIEEAKSIENGSDKNSVIDGIISENEVNGVCDCGNSSPYKQYNGKIICLSCFEMIT